MIAERKSRYVYEIRISRGEQVLINTLSDIYEMPDCEIMKMMLAFATYMANTRIINEINEGS